jgi:hypothetical protein
MIYVCEPSARFLGGGFVPEERARNRPVIECRKSILSVWRKAMVCSRCGKVVASTDALCRFCGNSFAPKAGSPVAGKKGAPAHRRGVALLFGVILLTVLGIIFQHVRSARTTRSAGSSSATQHGALRPPGPAYGQGNPGEPAMTPAEASASQRPCSTLRKFISRQSLSATK